MPLAIHGHGHLGCHSCSAPILILLEDFLASAHVRHKLLYIQKFVNTWLGFYYYGMKRDNKDGSQLTRLFVPNPHNVERVIEQVPFP